MTTRRGRGPIGKIWLAVLSAAVAATAPIPARAAWLEARSAHFTVYADTTEADLRATSTRLENFDALIRLFHALPQGGDQSLSPVTVYVVPDEAAVRRLYGSGSEDVAGFYIPRVSGSVAFTPRRGEGDGPNALKPQIVLFHEYGHHFLLGNYSAAYPAWFSEGYAEFVSTARFTEDGKAELGAAADHRAYQLFDGPMLTSTDLFAMGAKPLSADKIGSMYARGWLLTHYIMFTPGKFALFQRYVALLNAGTPSLDAAKQTFGDLHALDIALDHYLRARTMTAMILPISRLPVPTIAVRALRPGESAMIGVRMQSTRGVTQTTAPGVYQKAAKIAAGYPADPVVQGWLAEMACDAGQYDASEAAADRALAVDPTSIEALLYKARVHLIRAKAAHSTDPKIWSEARRWIIRANAVDHDDAPTLAAFYESYLWADAKPSASAVAGLERAFVRVPQDPSIRFLVARQLIQDYQVDEAKRTLRPLAYDPHAQGDNAAARLIAILDSGKTGDAALTALATAEKADAAKQ